MRKIKKSKIVDINNYKKGLKNIDPNNSSLKINHSDVFIKETKEMSKFINTLNLPTDTHNLLVNKLVAFTNKIQMDGFIQCLVGNFEVVEIEKND